MKPMDNKTPEMRQVIEDLFPGTMETINQNKCPLCKNPIGEFKNELSKKEYMISGMCQKCQDKIFTGE